MPQRQKSFGLWALRNKIPEATETEDIDADLFHSRRKLTKYRVGFEDLEDPVVNLIKETRNEMYTVTDKVKELEKEVLDYKRYQDMESNNRDVSFQQEVKDALAQ